MATVFGIVRGSIGLIDQSRGVIAEIHGQYKHYSKVPQKCAELEQGLAKLENVLNKLKEYDTRNMTAVNAGYLKETHEFLQDTQKILEEERDNASTMSAIRRFKRAKKVTEMMDKKIGELSLLKLSAQMIDLDASSKTRASEIVGEVEGCPFIPQHHNIPPTPHGLTLDMNNKSTYEGLLKEQVLKGPTNLVGAVGARGTTLAAAYGMSGVGKTCAVIAVGNDKDVQEHYNGGVYFFSFGPNVKDGDVIQMISDKVEATGGRQLAQAIRNEINIENAVEKGQGWFGRHKCLFICDDMWRCGSRNSGYVQEMRHLCSEQGGGCVLLSTRDNRVSAEVDERSKVRFDVRDEEKAGQILCGYIGISRDVVTMSNRDVRESYEQVLQSCCRLPVALAIAGKAIESFRKSDFI